ncbi:MAG: signal peptidase I [Syntrophomonadaceae bacterium]|nr:signal peptidase I [Syntrophomonadaceae bacterium]
MVTFLGTTLFPALAENLFLCYLAILGGPIPAIIFQGIVKAFHWFFPILPNMQWMTATLIGTFVPVLCLVLVQQGYLTETKKATKIHDQEDIKGSFIASVTVILLVWFAVGVFSIYPSVIISGSMYPSIKIGDMIIVKKCKADQINKGDIIQFEIENKIRIVHRVIDIKEENGQRYFITKGDNNISPDSDPVLAHQIKGNVVAILPKVGWATIAIRSNSLEFFAQTAEEVNSGGGSEE